ncbi:Uu.00g051090.m01.CDS01 [Anthostomella pinea]|uniref:Uu.00g051090.m01.CDS01 n=1 Tax=Anthostomella pinea TaxID=933095 RepID=A0AAI8VSQ4_9PEZI|nr:Uu.00g051090.m01.CDS01 [Anthostomella pinea]
MRRPISAAVLAAAGLVGNAHGQCQEVVPGQYTGTPFQNNLTSTHELSEITFFKIKDPSGQHLCTADAAGDLSLLAYQSLNTTLGRPVNTDIKRAIIVIHGALDDPWNYHSAMIQALQMVTNDDISPDTVAITAPYFPNDGDAGGGFPYDPSGTTPAEKYPSPALAWYFDNWSGGAHNQYPPNTKTVSSFDVLDQIVQWYGNKAMFPNINQIIIAGHSMGGQMAQRYAAIGKTGAQLGITTPVSYWIGDPNSFVWFATDRPESTGKCAAFDNYREGFTNYSAYGTPQSTAMTYNSALVAAGRDAILANFQSRTIAYARATLDKGDYNKDNSCSFYTTGADRNERFFEFIKRFPTTCPDPAGACKTVDIVVAKHDAPSLFQAPSGLTRLFYDNWDGSGNRAFDFGYPRHAPYDDPYPDPSQAGQPLVDEDNSTYAGGKTFRGCFTDVDKAQSVPSLPISAYVGTLNSKTYCSSLCTQQGYSIAGVSYENCYCGNALGSQTSMVVVTSCEGSCPAGPSTAFCGGPSRLSIFSSIDL